MDYRYRSQGVWGRARRGNFDDPTRKLTAAILANQHKNPGPGAYKIREDADKFARTRGKSFGYRTDMESTGYGTRSNFKKYGSKEISFLKKNNMLTQNSLNDDEEEQELPPGPALYTPSYNQVWAISSSYRYRNPVRSNQKNTVKNFEKKIEEKQSEEPSKTDSNTSHTSSSASSVQKIKQSPKKPKNPGTFGTAPKFHGTSLQEDINPALITPGPAEYEVDHFTIERNLELKNGAKLLGKEDHDYDNEVPGPGTYKNLDLDVIREVNKGQRLGQGPRSGMFQGGKQLPGPGHYEIGDFPPKFTRLSKSLMNSPSKNLRKANLSINNLINFEKSEVLSSEINPKKQNKENSEKVPYKKRLKIYNKKKLGYRGPTMPKATRSTSLPTEPQPILKKHPKKGPSRRKRARLSSSTHGYLTLLGNPGPGRYNVREANVFKKSSKAWTIGKRRQFYEEFVNKEKRKNPGPGRYKIGRFPDNEDEDLGRIEGSFGSLGIGEEGGSVEELREFFNIKGDKLVDIEVLVDKRNGRRVFEGRENCRSVGEKGRLGLTRERFGMTEANVQDSSGRGKFLS